MADPICDQMVMAFRLGESEQLGRVLRSVAAGGRAEVDLRRRVDASRSGALWTGRMIIGLTIGIALLLAVATHLRGPARPGGQLLLAVVVGIMALSIWAMERVGGPSPPPAARAPGDPAMIPWLLPALGLGIGLWLLLLGAMPARTSLAEGTARLRLLPSRRRSRPSHRPAFRPDPGRDALAGALLRRSGALGLRVLGGLVSP